MGGQSQPTTTTQIQKTELPAWVDAASQGNYAFAEQVANRPFEQYTGPRVAGLSGGEKAAAPLLEQGIYGSKAAYDAAGDALKRYAGGVTAPTVTAPTSFLGVNAPQAAGNVATMGPAADVMNNGGYLGVNAAGPVANVSSFTGARDVTAPGNVADVNAKSFLDANINSYMNPYTSNVVDTTLQGMRDNLAMSSQKADDAARGAGAWGSSRSGVTQAVLQSQGAKDMAATEAGLRSAAYTDAAGRIMQDNASALQAGMANQQKDITGNAQRLAAQQSNQNADLQTGQLNANIGIANQGSANTAAARNLSAQQTNAGNFLSANAQDIGVQQGNQASRNTNNALNAGILQGNQSSFLQNQAQALQAAISNQSAAANLQGLGVDAQKANATNSLAGAQLGMGAATNLGALGTDITNTAGKNALLSSQIGANERGIEQAKMDTDAAKWQEAYNAPLEALNTRLAALGMSPYGKTTTTNETKTGGTSSNTGLQALGGIMSFLPLMFSDKEVKKEIKNKGKIPGTDLNAYEFKYKKGFMGRDMPKQVGLMAQDVEKKVPGAVQTVNVNGKKVKAVDYGKAIAGARKPRGFMGRVA